MAWATLALAILAEVFGTTMLKVASQALTPWSVVGVAVGYGAAFALLLVTVRTLPLGLAYAVWSGAGTALIAVVGWIFFGQRLSAAALFGIALIVVGVFVVQFASPE